MADEQTRKAADELVPTVRPSGEVVVGDVAHPDMLPAIRAALENSPDLASAHTRRTYYSDLADFENWRAGRPVNKTLVQSYAAGLQAEGLSSATVNHRLAAVRWWARRLADLAEEDATLSASQRRTITRAAERAATVRNVKGDSPQRGRHVADGEVRALLQACVADDTPSSRRDASMIGLAFATGMRRAEIASLTLADLAPITDGYELTIRRAKGNKTRAVTVHNGARDYLRDWLQVRGDREGVLFLAIRKDGEILDHGMVGQSQQEMLAKRATEAGVVNVTWHDARRTLAGNLLDGGADLATVQRIMGHVSPVTTSAYDRRPEETRRKALRGLHVPYLRR